jgi:hypothetical protein
VEETGAKRLTVDHSLGPFGVSTTLCLRERVYARLGNLFVKGRESFCLIAPCAAWGGQGGDVPPHRFFELCHFLPPLTMPVMTLMPFRLLDHDEHDGRRAICT